MIIPNGARVGILKFFAHEELEEIIKVLGLIDGHILFVEPMVALNVDRMMVYSPLFRKVKDGDLVPEYTLSLTRQEDGEVILNGIS